MDKLILPYNYGDIIVTTQSTARKGGMKLRISNAAGKIAAMIFDKPPSQCKVFSEATGLYIQVWNDGAPASCLITNYIYSLHSNATDGWVLYIIYCAERDVEENR